MDGELSMKKNMTLILRRHHASSRRGVALLLVLSCLVLLAALILGFLLSGQNNLKSSKLYANGSSVRTLADSTVSLVMAQIQQATSNGTTVAWASQPGMIRTYDNMGAPLTNYRLYSWGALTATGAFDPNTDAAELTGTSTWYNNPALYYDLNQPVTDSNGLLHFPIIDGNPADFTTYTTTSGSLVNTYSINGVTPGIEGFWVNQANATTAGAMGPAINSTTNTASNHNTTDVPMPVKWLYVLQDGTIVAPTNPTGTKVTVTGASVANPIVGRIAYWTDDETSKVNINTASEGVYWDTPRTNGAFEKSNLATNQPTQNEFQRYPGHPAMTSLSTVLGSVLGTPSTLYNGMGSNPYTANNFKPYFVLAPKLNMGSTGQTTNLGSNAGTQAATTVSGTTAVGIGTTSFKTSERLYASVDELAFESGLANGLGAALPGGTAVTATGSYVRTTNNNGANATIAAANSSAASSTTGQFLEKARFFLTASSRAPDVNLFNQPRVVCWPIPLSATNQTPTDQTILWCGKINNKIYYFSRSRNDDPTNDLPVTATTSGLGRNRAVLNYLENEVAQNVPGFGGSLQTKYDSSTAAYAQGTSSQKQAAEVDQVLVEIFDYIRCLNLMDPNVTNQTPAGTQFAASVTGVSPKVPPSPYNTGLTPVWTTSNPWGGRGQVVPIIDTTANGYTAASGDTPMKGGLRGFGRFPTVEGATLMFICTGWNDGNHGNWSASDPNYNPPLTSYHDPAAWTSGTITGTTIPITMSGTIVTAAYPPGYAGYSTGTPVLWPNYVFNSGTGLLVNTPSAIPDASVRVQAVLIVNLFDPSMGSIDTYTNYHLQVIGLDSFMWQSDKSGGAVTMGFPSSSQSSAMGTQNYTRGVTNWVCSPVSAGNWGGKVNPLNFLWGMGPATPISSQGYYPFFSNSIDVGYTPTSAWSPGTNPSAITFTGGTITVNLELPQTIANASWQVNQPVQTVKLTFPSGVFPSPILCWRNQSPYDSGGFYQLQNRYTWGSRLGFGPNSWCSQATFIQAQDVTRSVKAYPGDPRIMAGRTMADSTADNYLYDDASQSHFPEYADKTQEMNHNIWSTQSMPLYGANAGNDTTWGQLVATTASGMVSYNGSGNIEGTSKWWVANTGMYPAAHNTSYPNSYPALGGGSSALDTTFAGGGCPTNGAFITKAGSNILDSGGNPIQGDFDNGFGPWSDGPYVNKADEGNTAYSSSQTPYYAVSYLNGNISNTGPTFFSPNRMMPSAGMFGSLSTGVIRNIAWMTLQFRPFPVGHPGIGNSTSSTGFGPPYSTTTGKGPPDHLFLDLFNMPVVEPYPISEPLSTAGRVNMNYQIAPFTYIQRSTAVRAVLKAERMAVIPNRTANTYKGVSSSNGVAPTDSSNNYHVPINVDQTLLGFEDWFSGKTTGTTDIFRSASQICDLYLYPMFDTDSSSGPTYDSTNTNITAFWKAHLLTGDNNLERPYANIYPRLTTKSNTFTVHYCVETLKKVAGSTATLWDEATDVVTGQYRGSSTIERYVDPNDTSIVDFTASANYNTALDKYYKFRVVSTKQFAP